MNELDIENKTRKEYNANIPMKCDICNKEFLANRKSMKRCSRECNQRAQDLKSKELRIFVNFMKILSGCVDCGYDRHPAALDFDHVLPGKIKNVAACKTLEEIEREIEKCEVVCANCHRIRTAERGQYGRPRIS